MQSMSQQEFRNYSKLPNILSFFFLPPVMFCLLHFIALLCTATVKIFGDYHIYLPKALHSSIIAVNVGNLNADRNWTLRNAVEADLQ